MWTKLWMVGLLALLVACGGQKSVKPPAPQAMGLLKVTITGIGESASPTATAQWVQSMGTNNGVSAQAATIVPVNGGSGLNDIQLIRRNVGFLDDDVAGQRNVFATFDLINRTTTAFNNLTLYAVHVPGNLGGSGIIGMVAGTGATITNASVARGFKPTHGMRSGAKTLEANPTIADLQFFTPTEAANMQTQGLTTPDPFNPGNNILPAGSTVLEYGFVARNYSSGRGIAARNTGSDCTVDACKGAVTLAYRFPKVNPRNANPFSFSLYFLVANETVQIGSQSIEEQTPNTVMGLSSGSVGSFAQIRTLLGSTFSGGNKNDLCSVRTAIPTVSNPDSLYLSSPGSLDGCFFDTDGKVTTPIGTGDDEALSLALQSDGKIVAAGYSNNGGSPDFSLARYNPNGTLDTTFDTDGKQTTSFGTVSDKAFSVAIQSNGKIVLAGFAFMSGFDFALARYNTDGSLDTSFGSGGKVTTDFGSGADEGKSVAIYPNDGGPNANKIVVAGSSFDSGISTFALARYNTDGTLDTTFDGDATMPGFPGNGKVTTTIILGQNVADAIAIQSDGKIVLAGRDGNGNFALARYNTNGSLDTSFDSDGKIITDFSSGEGQARSLAIQSDGKIVLAGFYRIDDNTDFALARYNLNGSLDTSFSGDGIVVTAIGTGSDIATSLAIQSDGKIVLAGVSSTVGSGDFALARYNSGGTLDTSFGTGGKVITSIGSGDDPANSLAIQNDGKIVLAGSSHNGLNYDFALARYNP